jgi:gliding motility-associated-like protein
MAKLYAGCFLVAIGLLPAALRAQCPTGATTLRTSTDVTCFGANDGTITVELADGAAPLNFELYDNFLGTFVTPTVTRTVGPFNRVVFSNVPPSIYQVVVFKTGCTTRVIIDPPFGFEITEPTALVASATFQPDCDTNPITGNGSIDVTVSGGTAPYTYAWADGPTTQDRTGLNAGSYSVTVRDANNCTTNVTVTIPVPTVANAGPDQSLCNNATTLAGSVPGAGESGLWTLVSGSGTITNNTSPTTTVTGLGFGTNVFRWTITTTVGPCPTRQDEVSIVVPPTLMATTTFVNVSCFGGTNGSINLTATGGTAPYTFLWNDGITTEDRSGLAAGSYSLTVTDTRGCTAIASVNITQPTELLLSTTQTNPLCFGAATGAIDLTVTGGTLPYSYAWSNGATTQDVSGLVPNTYSVTVTDGNGCVKNTSVIITSPTQVTFTSVKTDVSCNGGSDGSITVTAAGGTPGYQYSRDNGSTFQASPSFSGLTAGSYNVRVRDANGCLSAATVVNVTQPAAPVSFTFGSVGVLCFGDANGSITVNATGGTPPYQYSRDNGTSFQAGNVFSGLAAGNYNVLVRDSKNCTTVASVVNVGGPTAPLTFTASKIDVLCLGGNNGSISLTASGGTAPYSYSINGGSSFVGTSTFSSLTANTYNVIVRDANNCASAPTAITINQPATNVTFGTAVVNVGCFGQSTGAITINASGGTAPYTFSLNGGAFQPSNVFSGLSAGTYSIAVRDANNCPNATGSVSVTQPAAALSLTNTQLNVLCFGEATGSITVTPSGGTAPYEFSRDGGATFQTTNTFTGLVVGVYQLLVRDANLCLTAVTNATITGPAAALDFSSVQTAVACFGNATGQIAVTPSGGTPGYTYSRDGGTSFQASNVFAGLPAGTYSIVVQDANNCRTLPRSVAVTGPSAAVSFSTAVTGVNCFGGSTGAITVTASGGTPEYEYSIDNGNSFVLADVFSGLTAGVYDVVVRDGNNCTAPVSQVTITQPAAPLSISAAPTPIACFGETTGQINASASGGTAAYEFSLDGGAFQSSGIFSGLNVNAYSLQVRDSRGCIASTTVALTQPSAPLAIDAITDTDASCLGIDDGTVVVSSVTGGTPGYAYALNGGAFQPSNTFTGLAAATYTVAVRDANNCQTSASVTVDNAIQLVFSATPSPAVCLGINDGAIAFSGESGGTGPYTYSIDNGVNFGPSATVSALAPGTYSLVIKDAVNCRSVPGTVTVAAGTVITATVATTAASCANNDGTLEFTSVTGGTPGYAYSITGPAGPFIPNQTIFTDLVSTPGPAGYDAVVRDVNGCLSATQTVLVPISNVINIDTLYVNRTISLPDLPTGALTVGLVDEGNSPYEVALDLVQSIPFEGKTFSSGFQPAVVNPANGNWEVSFATLFAGFYRITVRNAAGCERIFENVQLLFDTNLVIPNIFTPNGDGVNDVFYIRNKTEFTSVAITNRWGKEVFSSNDYQNNWSGGELADGVYYYRINTAGQTFTGWVEILRH